MKLAVVFIAAALLSGCYRDSPEDQAKDFKVCTDAGMRPYRTGFGEIKCDPWLDLKAQGGRP